MVLFLNATYAKGVPTRRDCKLLNLGGTELLSQRSAALMRAVPYFGARCQRACERLSFGHPSWRGNLEFAIESVADRNGGAKRNE